jgi:hypothetical protein
VSDLDAETALAFLDALETDRHNAVVTRNHRRTALQAFFRYLGSVAPEYLAQCRRVLAIPRKRAPSADGGLLSARKSTRFSCTSTMTCLAVGATTRSWPFCITPARACKCKRLSTSPLPHSNSIGPTKCGSSAKVAKNGFARCGRRRRRCCARSSPNAASLLDPTASARSFIARVASKIDLRRLRRLVPEPQGNHRAVDARRPARLL